MQRVKPWYFHPVAAINRERIQTDKSEGFNSENADLFVYVPLVQTVYFLPPKVSIVVQLPKRPVGVKISRDIAP